MDVSTSLARFRKEGTICHPAYRLFQQGDIVPLPSMRRMGPVAGTREMTGAEFRKIRIDRLCFTVAEAAVMFGCDERTVKRWQADEVRIPGSVALALGPPVH